MRVKDAKILTDIYGINIKEGVNMNDILKKISDIGIVPVVVLDDAKDAEPLAKALIEGGLPCAEVTFRTDAAEESIRIMAEKYPQMLVGAGTVLTEEQVDRAVKAGAKFIVAPGLNEKIVKYCQKKGVPMVPGVNNPSNIEAALELGLDVVKFFPAEASGGIGMIKAMAAPYTSVKFMPTGGISAENICEYLAFDKIIACGGSWMVKKDLIRNGKFDEIKKLTEEAVRTMLCFDLRHIGINCSSKEESGEVANRFADYFGFGITEGTLSYFAGSQIETMNQKGRGRCGHIAIETYSIERAMNYLSTVKGVKFDKDSIMWEGDKIKLIYLEGDFGGFEVHLSRRLYK